MGKLPFLIDVKMKSTDFEYFLLNLTKASSFEVNLIKSSLNFARLELKLKKKRKFLENF